MPNLSILRTVVPLVASVFLSPIALAENKFGSESLVQDANRILSAAGVSGPIPPQPVVAASATPYIGKVKPAGVSSVTADVTGLIIRFRSDEVKLLSRANQPPPQTLTDEVARLAGTGLTFRRAMSMDSYVFRFASPLSWSNAQSAIDRIKASPNVEAVDADARSDHSMTPNDTYAISQWNLQKPTAYAGSANLGPAWDMTRGSSNTIVAVVDTGVRPHPEFSARLLPGHDFVSDPLSANDGGGRDVEASDPGDWHAAGECGAGGTAGNSSWHGTHVTGIIAATGNNSAGIAGVNWNTRILPVRVLGKCGGSLSDIIDGMVWAAGLSVPGVPDNPFPAKVINMSLGGPNPSGCLPDSQYQVAINRIKSRGALIVVAAGNDDTEAAIFVPASCSGVMTVAAVGPYGGRASYSNYSTRGSVDISAPGGDSALFGEGAGIASTFNSGQTAPGNSNYGYKDGTSMAAPHVAGIATLAIGLDPAISPELLQLSLILSARSFPTNSVCTTYYPLCGLGIVDAVGTLNVVNAFKPYLLVYEFKNTNLNHYFRTSAAVEYSNVLNGSAGPGWVDTKDYYLAWRDTSQGASPVCRFYSPSFNSHFYTASASECETVKRNPVWNYEGIVYYAKLPVNGTCPAGSKPIYRAYNNLADGNHRFSTEKTVIDTLVAQKWRYEGIVMCAAGG